MYFWANENRPLEPIRVHIAEGQPTAYATKVWITKSGKCLLCHNNSDIPQLALCNMMRIIEARSEDVIAKWIAFFGDVQYFC